MTVPRGADQAVAAKSRVGAIGGVASYRDVCWRGEVGGDVEGLEDAAGPGYHDKLVSRLVED